MFNIFKSRVINFLQQKTGVEGIMEPQERKKYPIKEWKV